jgi:hypothetical protein
MRCLRRKGGRIPLEAASAGMVDKARATSESAVESEGEEDAEEEES